MHGFIVMRQDDIHSLVATPTSYSNSILECEKLYGKLIFGLIYNIVAMLKIRFTEK